MTQFPAFPKIFTIGGHDYIRDIFDGPVEVTEKIDGSQFAWMYDGQELHCRSKGTMQHVECPDKMFNAGVNFLSAHTHLMRPGLVYYAEYLRAPKHNTLEYARIPKNHFALFGVMDTSRNNTFESQYVALSALADELDIDVVPEVYNGIIDNVEQVLDMINRESYLGSAHVEGIVVKNYNKPFLLGGQPIPVMAGKHVSEAFKETHRTSWSKEHTDGGKLQRMRDAYRTEARWRKAVEHMRDDGELLSEPKDIGQLIKRIHLDIEEEEKENIKEELWKIFGGDIKRTACKGFPEWYKNELLKGAFE